MDPWAEARLRWLQGKRRSGPRTIAELQLSARVENALYYNGIRKPAQLLQKTAWQLLALRAFGERSVEEVREKLAVFGLALAADGV